MSRFQKSLLSRYSTHVHYPLTCLHSYLSIHHILSIYTRQTSPPLLIGDASLIAASAVISPQLRSYFLGNRVKSSRLGFFHFHFHFMYIYVCVCNSATYFECVGNICWFGTVESNPSVIRLSKRLCFMLQVYKYWI